MGSQDLKGDQERNRKNMRDVENISIPYYVTNFPLTADVKQIRKEFQKFGTMVDIFIAPRLSSAVTGDKVKNKVITLQGNEIKNEYSKYASIFAKVRLVKSIPHLPMLLREEGFSDVNVKYVGSDWVYLMFDSEEVCSKFKKAKGIRSLFSILRPVLNGFHIKDRIVWMDVSGLPCCAWNDVAVTKVVSSWGSNDGNHSEGDQERENDDLEQGEMGFEYQHQQDHATHGAGFVDRSRKFYDTSGIKNGRFTVNNENNKFVKTKHGSKVDENGDEVIKKGPSLAEARLEKEVGSRGSKSDSLLYRGRRSNSLGSIKSYMKRVPVDVDTINDVMAQYMEMGNLLGYDMESNKLKVEKMLGRSGAFIKVVQ
ncbi:hypothetical protein L1887_23970 [Cichorium endivia]|nr:hypothetical protein L1887_23970 [Cichorium endivia]